MTDRDIAATFRQKVVFMKSWKPASMPSNRDRLELYALHKQSVSGNAPTSFPSTASAAEKAKYNTWRTKSGLAATESMKLYLQESDRQIRVYGSTSTSNGSNKNNNNNNNNNRQATNGPSAVRPTSSSAASITSEDSTVSTPRGIAAIPLLCAAAGESRAAYLRRISQTPAGAAWWARQEALCGENPSSLLALPETLVVFLAKQVEALSLASGNNVLRALLWPLHNSLLSLWIMAIACLTLFDGVLKILQVVVFGARRTGISLNLIWKDLNLLVSSIHGACQPQQAITCRLVGLGLLPATYTVSLLDKGFSSVTLASVALVTLFTMNLWYFIFVLPWAGFWMLWFSVLAGFSFAVIEFAGS
ncbi:MAG: hypothetical protein SGBAC_003069 [Bacillariaceae sp.]